MLLNKPPGVVTTASDPQGRPTVVGLVEHESRVVPVGRLDVDTTGALLLTNDGPLAHRLAHPRYGVEKVYEVETWKEPNDEALRRLAEGVELEDGVTSPARVRRLGAARFELVLHEGRNRQVRRMCEAVGHRVRRLHRSVYAGLRVDGIASGEWRELTAAEVEQLRRSVSMRSVVLCLLASGLVACSGGDGPAEPTGAALLDVTIVDSGERRAEAYRLRAGRLVPTGSLGGAPCSATRAANPTARASSGRRSIFASPTARSAG